MSAAKERMDALRKGTAGAILAEFLRERHEARVHELVQCNEKTFLAHQGRCRELEELIKYVEGR